MPRVTIRSRAEAQGLLNRPQNWLSANDLNRAVANGWLNKSQARIMSQRFFELDPGGNNAVQMGEEFGGGKSLDDFVDEFLDNRFGAGAGEEAVAGTGPDRQDPDPVDLDFTSREPQDVLARARDAARTGSGTPEVIDPDIDTPDIPDSEMTGQRFQELFFPGGVFDAFLRDRGVSQAALPLRRALEHQERGLRSQFQFFTPFADTPVESPISNTEVPLPDVPYNLAHLLPTQTFRQFLGSRFNNPFSRQELGASLDDLQALLTADPDTLTGGRGARRFGLEDLLNQRAGRTDLAHAALAPSVQQGGFFGRFLPGFADQIASDFESQFGTNPSVSFIEFLRRKTGL